MNIHRPLFWHQGLFLQPQHFQIQDRAAHCALIPFRKYLQPHFWGVGEVEINRAALGAGVFQIKSGKFLFPDGSYLEFPGNTLLASRRFDPQSLEGKPVPVYLGLKKWDEAGANVKEIESAGSLCGESATHRFVTVSDPEEVNDLHADGPAAGVRTLYHLLGIFWEGELDRLCDHHLIPLALLEKEGQAVRLSSRFVPPVLSFGSTDSMRRLACEIRDQLAAGCRELEGCKRQRVGSIEPGTREMTSLLALKALNRFVPLFFHLIEGEQAHPWVLYGLLRQLVGELSSFSHRIDLFGLPPYDHTRLWDCFSAASSLVTRLLQEITAGPDYVVRFLDDRPLFGAAIDPPVLEKGNRYFLGVKTQQDPKAVLQSIASVAKLSAPEHLSLLAYHALPGIPLEFLEVPPPELPRRSRTLYFALDHCHEQWEHVVNEQGIALQWDNAPDDVEVELFVVTKLSHPA